MLSSFLKIAYRSLIKDRSFAITNIVGLTTGIVVSIFLLEYIRFEMSFDNFHTDGDRIYRISVNSIREGKHERGGPDFVAPIGPAMTAEFPEVETFVRFSTPRVAYLSHGNTVQEVENIRFADSTAFGLLSFNLLRGNEVNALSAPNTAVLTPPVASLLFSNEDPVGKEIVVDNGRRYTVTGIVDPPPSNSQLSFNVLLSFSTLYTMHDYFLDWNGGNQYVTYIRLVAGTSQEQVQEKFPAFMWEHINKEYAAFSIALEPTLQPLVDVHMYYEPGSDQLRMNLMVAAGIASIILLIACINFANLATARSLRRVREIGIRKVFGAFRGQLFLQFFAESLVLSLLAGLLSIPVVESLRPYASDILGSEFSAMSVFDPLTIILTIALVSVAGLAGAVYPAWMLARADTFRSLRGLIERRGPKGSVGNVLVVIQFAFSIGLIASTLLMQSQIDFVRQKNPGFDKDHVVVLPLVGEEAQQSAKTLKSELSRVPGVVRTAAASRIPRSGFTMNGYVPEGLTTSKLIHVVDIDEDFLSLFGIPLVNGRGFDKEQEGTQEYLVNQAFAPSLSWDDPVGRSIVRNGRHTIRGVVADFHFATLHERIEPLILTNRPESGNFRTLAVKIQPGDPTSVLEGIRSAWSSVLPATPFQYEFLDESFDRLYRADQRFASLFLWSSALAILLAVLGLIGVAAYAVRRKTKEIGIRKVLGASAAGVSMFVARGYMTPVIVANVIAWPVAYAVMQRWLEDFAYRIGIDLWIFVVAGGVTLVVAFCAVFAQTIRAASANPVESLRYE